MQLAFNLTSFYPEVVGKSGNKRSLEVPNDNFVYILDPKKTM
tara:strand:+ start:63 stop:188 length:126 start_codon:yes stop_codon:yes gene_type:complete